MENANLEKDELITRLGNEIFFCMEIKQYLEELYSKQNLYLFKEAMIFFSDFYKMLLELLVLRIARLYDPAEQNEYENFSFEKLLSFITDSNKKIELEAIQKELKTKIGYLKHLRHKAIAHLDFHIKKENLTSDDIEKIKESAYVCLDGLRKLYEAFFNDTELSDRVVSNSIDSLINVLHHGNYILQHQENPEIKKIVQASKKWRPLIT